MEKAVDVGSLGLLAVVLAAIRDFFEFSPRGTLKILLFFLIKAIFYIILSGKTNIRISIRIMIYMLIIIIDVLTCMIALYIVRDGYITIFNMNIIDMVITGKVFELIMFPLIVFGASEGPTLWAIENGTEWLLFGEIISLILVGICYFLIYVIFNGW